MCYSNLFKLLIMGTLALNDGFTPVFKSMTKIIKRRLDTENESPIYELENVVRKEMPCVLFFTGLNSVIPGEIYDTFLSHLSNQGVSVYVAGPNMEETDELLEELVDDYANVTVVGHSSGSINAINQCSKNKDVKTLVLLDPVDNSFIFNELRNKPLVLKKVEKVLFLNADRSYAWNLSPNDFTVPFIPSFELKPDDLTLKKATTETIVASDFGHSDILDDTWSNMMHETISKGSYNRNEDLLNEYKYWLSTIIKNFITDEEYEEIVKTPEEHVDEAMDELGKFYTDVTSRLAIRASKIISSRKVRSVNNTSILYRKV